MSITDELRKWGYGFCGDTHDVVTAIADRIDAEHEAKVAYWQGASYKDGYDEGFASADDWLAQNENAMAEHGWVHLPLDINDVPIRIDDALVLQHEVKVGVPFPGYLEEVIWVVQCGIDETKVFPVALKDVELLGEDFNEGCEFQKVGSDGYPFCASATEIMRLRDVLESYAKTFDGWAVENNGGGRQMDGPDWLELANELRMDRDVPVENMVMFERSEYEMWRLRLMNIYEREVDGDEDEEGK